MATRRRSRLIGAAVAAVVVVGAVVVIGVLTSNNDEHGRRPDQILSARVNGAASDGLSLAWSSDGERLVVLGATGIRAFAGRPLAETGRVEIAPDVNGWSWSPDATKVALWFKTGAGLIVDVATGSTSATLAGGNERTVSRWSPDGTSIAFTDADHNVTIADAASGQVRTQTTAYQDGDGVQSMEWVGDDRIAVVGYQLVGLFDAATGAAIWQHSFDLLGGELAVDPGGTAMAVSVHVSTDDQILSLTDGGTLGTFETERGYAKAFSWSFDGNWMFAAGDDDQPILWDATARATSSEYPGLAPYGIGGVWAPADDRVAITDAYDQRILVTDVTGAVDDDELSIAADSELTSTRWSPTGERLAALGDGNVFVWNMSAISD